MKRRLRYGVASVVGTLCVVAAAGCFAPTRGAAPPQARRCAGNGASTTSRVWLEAEPHAPRDTLWILRVCMRPAHGTRVGSFHLAMEYDPSALRALRIVRPSSGSVVANLHRPGRADVAGADPHGFAPGELMRLVLRRVERTRRAERARRVGNPSADVRLEVLELNGVRGRSLMEHLRVTGLGAPSGTEAREVKRPPPSVPGEPHLDSVVPSRVPRRGPGELVRVVIHGSGFQTEGNVVLLDGIAIAELPSRDGHTLRLMLPDHFPGTGEVAPRVLTAGRYEMRVRTAAGTSNEMIFIVGTPP